MVTELVKMTQLCRCQVWWIHLLHFSIWLIIHRWVQTMSEVLLLGLGIRRFELLPWCGLVLVIGSYSGSEFSSSKGFSFSVASYFSWKYFLEFLFYQCPVPSNDHVQHLCAAAFAVFNILCHIVKIGVLKGFFFYFFNNIVSLWFECWFFSHLCSDWFQFLSPFASLRDFRWLAKMCAKFGLDFR